MIQSLLTKKPLHHQTLLLNNDQLFNSKIFKSFSSIMLTTEGEDFFEISIILFSK